MVELHVHVLLRSGRNLLLLKRFQTGHCDGQWGLVAGGVEEGEHPKPAACREVYEEVGVAITPSSLQWVAAGHQILADGHVCLFFLTDQWQGSPYNKEPHKCSELAFFNVDHLPDSLMPGIGHVIAGARYFEL